MGIIETAVKRPVTILMTVLAVVAFGGLGLTKLPLNLLPDISHPSLTVQTELPNAAPGEVENLVTQPVEEAVGVLRGLQEVHSVSRAGISEVTLTFGWGADMDLLAMDIREKLDRLILPDDAEKPIVLRYDPALDPIMRVALTGSDDLILMRYIAEEEIKDDLEKIEGVAAAQVKGGEEEEIQINLEQGKVSAMNLTVANLSRLLDAANINRPGGSLEGESTQYLVRTLNEYNSVEEIAELTVTPVGRPPVRLGDIAEVKRGTKDREEITRVNGQEAVVLEIFKEGDANTVRVAERVKEAIGPVTRKLPDGMGLTLLYDQSRFIERAIAEVRDALLIGGILAIVVLFLFLRDPRATLIIATSIPISVVATFVLMYYMNVSLNIMSLGGLTLGIGMLVDSSIVVLETIARHRERGATRFVAAIEGAREVGGAVIASTLTTVAVFFPIVFVEGIAGQMFRDQSLTVTFSLMASLIVSLTFIPMLASLGKHKAKKDRASLANEAPETDETLGWFSGIYEKFLRFFLRLRWLTLAAATLLFVATLQMFPMLKRELIPTLSEGEFFYEVTMPEGTSLPATDLVLRKMEQIAGENPGIEKIYASVGSRTVSGGLSLKTKDENLGQLNVVLAERGNAELEKQVSAELSKAYAHIPNLEAKLGRPSFFSMKTAVEVLVYGEDLDELQAYTLGLQPKIAQVDGIGEVRASLETGNPELNVVFDREKLARMGMTIGEVSNTLNARINGEVVSQFKEGDRQIDIRIRNRMADRDSVGDIRNLVVAQYNGAPVTLKAVAEVNSTRGPAEIHRVQQSRVGILSADLADGSLGDVVTGIQAVLAANPPPPNLDVELGGQSQEMQGSFASLQFAMLLAIFLVYLVMAATFENLIHPFIILFTVPLALSGVILGLYLFDIAISIIALIGVIFLVGVVVNNAIVLVDAINRSRRAGMEKLEATVHAGKLRLRPILMTTLTTILGLIPMAAGFGEGAALRQPLAVAVSCGLAFSTLLTLVVIPSVYMIVPSTVRTQDEEDELEAVIAEAAHLEASHT